MTFKEYVNGIIAIGNNIIIPIIFALALLVFIWGVLKYFLLHGEDQEKRIEGRKFVLWGILGMVLLFSVWGVVSLLLSTLGLT